MIAIIGPTGSGKTDLAVQISAKLSINVVNADSRQIYKLMDIGTAKPTSTERKKLKHYLIDEILPNESYNLNQFIKEAKNAINPELAVKLADLWESIRNDDSIRVVVLTGIGDVFCAGADLGAR